MGFAFQQVAPSSHVVRRLSQLGITADDAWYVGTAMVQAAIMANPLGPRSEAGNLRFARGVSAWAEALLPRGWRRESPDGCDLITSPNGEMSICVTSGDHNVGMMADPKPRYPRGAATRGRIDVNEAQFGMPTILGPSRKAKVALPILWITLHNQVQDQLYLELSLPARIEGDSRNISWKERLRLGVYGWNGDSLDPGGHNSTPPSQPSGPVITIRPK